MIPNNTIVYLSSLLQDRYPDFTESLKEILTEEGISVRFLSITKDIWCRDFMPVPLSKDRYIQFVYKPDYLVGFEDRRTNPYDVDPGISPVFHSKLVIDGGNVIKQGSTAILSNKIFKENPAFRNRKPKLIQQLTHELEVEKVVIIPKDPSDISGHSDGMVRFVSENTVIMNEYLESDRYSPNFIFESVKALTSHGIRVAGTLPYRAFNRKNRDGDYTAFGCYINYLEVDSLIVFPTFGISEDLTAFEKIHQFFPSKRIVQIDCKEIAEEGGVLNCISWNL